MKTQTPKVKVKLKCENVTKDGCNVICEIESRDLSLLNGCKVKLNCSYHVVRIMSDHTFNVMRLITTHLDQTEILKYAKDMMKSHTGLQEVREIG